MRQVQSIDRFLRLREVLLVTGLTRSSVYRMIATNDFPRPVHLAARAVAWPESEIVIWQNQRMQMRVGEVSAAK